MGGVAGATLGQLEVGAEGAGAEHHDHACRWAGAPQRSLGTSEGQAWLPKHGWLGVLALWLGIPDWALTAWGDTSKRPLFLPQPDRVGAVSLPCLTATRLRLI